MRLGSIVSHLFATLAGATVSGITVARAMRPYVASELTDLLSRYAIEVHRPAGQRRCENGEEVELPEKTYTIIPNPFADPRVKLLQYIPVSMHHCGWGDIVVVGIDDLETPEEADDYFDVMLRIQLKPSPSTAILIKGTYNKKIYYDNELIYEYTGRSVQEGENPVVYYYTTKYPKI